MAGIFKTYDVMQDYENIDFILVGSDDLENGYLVIADALSGTYLNGFGSVYTPAKPSAITNANIAIVCAEEYYQDAEGNRINITDPTVLTFTEGQRIRVLRPALNKKYFASASLYTGVAVVGKYLIPTAASYGFTVADDLTGNPKVALKIEEINVKDTFVGLAAVTGIRVRCVRANGE
jgi:hypothetical protein